MIPRNEQGLTPKQKAVYLAIKAYKSLKGHYPTMRQILEKERPGSRQYLAQLIQELEKKGFVKLMQEPFSALVKPNKFLTEKKFQIILEIIAYKKVMGVYPSKSKLAEIVDMKMEDMVKELNFLYRKKLVSSQDGKGSATIELV